MQLALEYPIQSRRIGQISTIFRNRGLDMGFNIGTGFQSNFIGSARSSEGDAERDMPTWD